LTATIDRDGLTANVDRDGLTAAVDPSLGNYYCRRTIRPER
jgi:hypothetical protein